MTPRVAIVVACHDAGTTLEETVATITCSEEPVELVVVDDGSTDTLTVSVLDRLEAAGVRVLHRPHGGPSSAAMAGVEATSAPYVMRFDADDLLEPGAVGALADALDARSDAAAAWGDMETFGLTTFRVVAPPSLDPWLLTYVNLLPGAGCLIRRSALVELGGWTLRDGHEDWDLWLVAASHGLDGVRVPEVVFRYRRGEGGRLRQSLADTTQHYEALRARHEELWHGRGRSRASSAAPHPLRVLLPIVERLPVSRLRKIHLCELLARIFWVGGVISTVRMMRQAAAIRARRLARR